MNHNLTAVMPTLYEGVGPFLVAIIREDEGNISWSAKMEGLQCKIKSLAAEQVSDNCTAEKDETTSSHNSLK